MSKKYHEITNNLFKFAQNFGADSADSLLIEANTQSIEVLNSSLEHAERAEGIDIGLRVFVGKRQACVSASDLNQTTLEVMAERAVAMAKEAPEDPYCGLAEPDQLVKNWDVNALELCDPSEEPKPQELEQVALEAEASALAVKGVSQVIGSGAGYSRTNIYIAQTNGFSGGYSRSSRYASCGAISGEGLTMEREYNGESRIFACDMPSADEIGRIAGERAVARINTQRPPTGSFPVLFDERVSSTLIGHLVSAVNGRAIVNGASWLKDAIGEDVLPKELSLIEDPHRIRVSGSKPFDAEGLAPQERSIVKNGTLSGWTLDLSTARKLGLESTASAGRGVSAPPSPVIGNLALTQGKHSYNELVSLMGTGLIVTSLIGSTINPNTGDYSRGASGFWVENGQIVGPVNECTIAGNLREMLCGIVPANDGRTYLSRVVPSILVEGMTIAGK